MNKKIVLLYPYYNGISGAYNRYLLLEKLIIKTNFKVKLIVLKDPNFYSKYPQIFYKLFKFIQVELLIFFYSVLRNCYFITDFNPSIIALFSKKVFIQIHDVSWQNRKFKRYNFFFYKILNFFIRYYSNILTVSETSMLEINKVSARKKRISYLYNSVTENYINESNFIGKYRNHLGDKIISCRINSNIPNILYIATLTPRKSHFDLLESIANCSSLLNVNLVGLPTDKEILELIKNKKTLNGNHIQSNINYFPKLSQNELCNLLIYSSAYISTSMDEGFGIPVLEAKIYKVPLIIRDIRINRELFPRATFFKSNNQLTSLLNNLKKTSKFEVQERKKIASNLNPDNIIDPFNYSDLSDKLKDIILNSA